MAPSARRTACASIALPGSSSLISFSTDETLLFYVVGTTLHRYNIASGVDDTFSANNYLQLTNERYLVSANVGAPYTYQLVTTSTATTSATVAGEG